MKKIMNKMFNILKRKRLILGVCGYIANDLNVNVLIVRLTAIMLVVVLRNETFSFENPFIYISIPLIYTIYVFTWIYLRKKIKLFNN